eukprot:scaffold1692_cov59-Phaeocystis_antarctica.AAC.1
MPLRRARSPAQSPGATNFSTRSLILRRFFGRSALALGRQSRLFSAGARGSRRRCTTRTAQPRLPGMRLRGWSTTASAAGNSSWPLTTPPLDGADGPLVDGATGAGAAMPPVALLSDRVLIRRTTQGNGTL